MLQPVFQAGCACFHYPGSCIDRVCPDNHHFIAVSHLGIDHDVVAGARCAHRDREARILLFKDEHRLLSQRETHNTTGAQLIIDPCEEHRVSVTPGHFKHIVNNQNVLTCVQVAYAEGVTLIPGGVASPGEITMIRRMLDITFIKILVPDRLLLDIKNHCFVTTLARATQVLPIVITFAVAREIGPGTVQLRQ